MDNRKLVSTFNLVVKFSVFVCLRWMYHHMLSASYISRESWCCVSLSLCSLVICANNWVHHGPTVLFVSLHITLPHYHHYAYIYIITKSSFKKRAYQKLVWPCWCVGWYDTVIVSCLVSNVHFSYSSAFSISYGYRYHMTLCIGQQHPITVYRTVFLGVRCSDVECH